MRPGSFDDFDWREKQSSSNQCSDTQGSLQARALESPVFKN